MLLLICLAVISIVAFTITYYDDKTWHTEVGFVLGSLFGIFSTAGLIVAIIILICTWCNAPASQATYEEKYIKLTKQVEHIDSYNHDDIKTEVDEWNRQYRINTYAPKSPWVGIFYSLDTSTVDLIELNE